jgi:Xaa-Pro aminopeptidase
LEGGPAEKGAPAAERRADIEAKQVKVAALLQEVGSEALLVQDPDNIAWLTAGAALRGIIDPAALPALFYMPEERWLICSSTDTQRLFDEEIDGLGFQLKEWAWYAERDQLLSDLCRGRRVASDRPLGELKVVAEQLRKLRRPMTAYEQACYRDLGQLVAHALEATCRSLRPNESEEEAAGMLAHRVVHHGADVLAVGVAADGRSRRYRQFGFAAAAIRRYCVLTVTARKHGLCLSASRAMSFGTVDAQFRQEFNVATLVAATYITTTWPDSGAREILSAGKRIYKANNFEHEWLARPQGHITGRAPVELNLKPSCEELLQPNWVVAWHPSVGAALVCDTFLVTPSGPKVVTPTENWPLKKIAVQGVTIALPELLQR